MNAARSLKVWVAVDGKNFAVELPKTWTRARVVGEPVSGGVAVNDDGLSFLASVVRSDANGSGAAISGAILAPMPGKVIALDVAEGQEVEKGERLMVLEAMKMEHTLTAPFAGRVADLPAKLGAQVEVEALLARIEQGEG